MAGWQVGEFNLALGATKELIVVSPRRLRLGNAFQELVQADFIDTDEGAEKEVRVEFGPTGNGNKNGKFGRVDIWIDVDSDNNQIAVFEIKATDWDLIESRNVRRNVYRHQKQLWDYVHKYHFEDHLQATYGLIYPSPPEREGLREAIEELAWSSYQVVVYWYNELNPDFDLDQLASSLDD